MPRERRKNFRVEWNSPGTIYDKSGDPGYPCVINDLSNGGVKISGVIVKEVPDHFTLRIAEEAKTRKCQVLWRKADSLGVEFTDRFPLPDTSPARSSRKAKRPAHA